MRASRALLAAVCLLATAAPIRAQGIPTLGPAAAAAHFRAVRRARALAAGGRWADAEPLLAAAAAETPDDGGLWYALGRARAHRGEAAAAVDAYRRSVETGYGADPWTAHRVARLYAGLGAADSALAWLSRSLALGWDDRPGIADDPAFASLRDDPRFRRLAGVPADPPPSRDEGWRRDIDYLIEEVRRMHVAAAGPAVPATFDSTAAALKARVPELTNEQVLAELRRLLVTLGDGHTAIYGPGPDSPLAFDGGVLPLELHEFTDGLFVVDGVGDLARWAGSRVLRIGDVPAERALAELAAYTNHDNGMTVRWLGDFFVLPTLEYLRAIGAAGPGLEVALALRGADGTERRVTVRAVTGPFPFPRKLRPPPGQTDPPLWLRRVDTNYRLEPIPGHDALYFQFNQVRDMEGGPPIAAFADTLRAALERTAAKALIVDVRHDNGGNNGLLRPLVRTLVWWEMADPGHRLFVITGRNTFSAAQNFVNRVERWTDATFVGEPSSSRPNFAGEETNLTLPYSRVHGSVSTLYWQDSDPTDTRRYVYPDVPVGTSSADYFAGRDPALEAIWRVMDAGAAPPASAGGA